MIINWLYYPTRAGLLLLLVLMIGLSMPVFASGPAEQTRSDLSEKIQNAMVYLVRAVPRHPIIRDRFWREKLAGIIIDAGDAYGEDPYLLTVMFYCESTFRTSAIGPSRGEVGLGQVHGMAARGCDLSHPRGQAMCSARWLARARALCDGSDEQTLTAYAVGRCRSRSDRVEYIVNRRIRMRDRIKSR